jgi:hypothetical protein
MGSERRRLRHAARAYQHRLSLGLPTTPVPNLPISTPIPKPKAKPVYEKERYHRLMEPTRVSILVRQELPGRTVTQHESIRFTNLAFKPPPTPLFSPPPPKGLTLAQVNKISADFVAGRRETMMERPFHLMTTHGVPSSTVTKARAIAQQHQSRTRPVRPRVPIPQIPSPQPPLIQQKIMLAEYRKRDRTEAKAREAAKRQRLVPQQTLFDPDLFSPPTTPSPVPSPSVSSPVYTPPEECVGVPSPCLPSPVYTSAKESLEVPSSSVTSLPLNTLSMKCVSPDSSLPHSPLDPTSETHSEPKFPRIHPAPWDPSCLINHDIDTVWDYEGQWDLITPPVFSTPPPDPDSESECEILEELIDTPIFPGAIKKEKF